MLYAIPFLVILVIVMLIWQYLSPYAKRAAERRRRAASNTGSRPGSYEWDRRLDQAARQMKRVPGPSEQRDQIVEWLTIHEGVEFYVEPKTVMHPLSVVLVDGAGEAKRFELREDAFLRQLASERGIKVFDASRVGYPERMRRHKQRDQGEAPPAGQPE
jgi:hypothetical protein